MLFFPIFGWGGCIKIWRLLYYSIDWIVLFLYLVFLEIKNSSWQLNSLNSWLLCKKIRKYKIKKEYFPNFIFQARKFLKILTFSPKEESFSIYMQSKNYDLRIFFLRYIFRHNPSKVKLSLLFYNKLCLVLYLTEVIVYFS